MADILISEAEKQYICQGIKQDFRSDGRSCFDYRKIEIETNVITNCFGSAHIRFGNCDVMAAVKVELIKPEIDEKDAKPVGNIQFFVDLSANASPFFEGRGGEDIGNSISATLTEAYEHSFDFSSLIILDTKYAWCINVDILILEVGSRSALYDACAFAAKVALVNTSIPEVTIDELGEAQISDDVFNVFTLNADQIPLLLSLTRVSGKYIVDATQEEEAASFTSLVFAFDTKGNILHFKNIASGSFYPEALKEMIPKMEELVIRLHSLTSTLAKSDS